MRSGTDSISDVNANVVIYSGVSSCMLQAGWPQAQEEMCASSAVAQKELQNCCSGSTRQLHPGCAHFRRVKEDMALLRWLYSR